MTGLVCRFATIMATGLTNGGQIRVQDHYQVLGVPYDAKPAAIRSAYRRLAKRYHPDVSGDPASLEQMQRVNDAYEVLGNPFLKTIYDYIYFGNPDHIRVSREPASKGRSTGGETAVQRQDIVYNPTPIQQKMSGFALFVLRWQDRLPALFLVPLLTLMVAITFDLWEIGAGIVFVAGGMAILSLMLVILAHFLGRAGISLE